MNFKEDRGEIIFIAVSAAVAIMLFVGGIDQIKRGDGDAGDEKLFFFLAAIAAVSALIMVYICVTENLKEKHRQEMSIANDRIMRLENPKHDSEIVAEIMEGVEELKKKGVNTTALDMCILSEEKYPIQLAAVDELFALCDKAKKAELYRQDRDAYKQAYENMCVFYKQLVAANQKLAESHEAVEHSVQADEKPCPLDHKELIQTGFDVCPECNEVTASRR